MCRQFFKKPAKKRENEMKDEFISILPSDFKLISFAYTPKMFGNIRVEIHTLDKKHIFFTDRGEIYHQFKNTEEDFWHSKMCCDHSYMHFEQQDTFHKLLQVIKTELQL